MKNQYFIRAAAGATMCLLSFGFMTGSGMAQQSGATASAGASANVQANGTANRSGKSTDAQAGAGVQAGASANASGPRGQGSADGSANGSGSVSTSAMPVELVTKLDSKSAKAGDVVVAKTTRTVKMADGTLVRKGAKLMGTVSQTQAYSKGQAEGMLALSFNRLEMSGGQELQLASSIDSVSPPANAAVAGDVAGDEMVAAGPVSSDGSVGGRGGLGLGGAVGGATGAVGGASSAVGRTSGGLASSAQGVGGQAAGVTRGAAGSVNGAVSGAAQQSTGVAAHATNLPGVMLSGAAAGSTSSVLSASNRNVHLDSGTQMVLSVAAQR